MRSLARISKSITVLGLAGIFLTAALAMAESKLNMDRDRANGMLDIIVKTLAKNYYDPKMEGLDWRALVKQTHKEIDQSTSNGQMLSSMYALVDRLHDSHTVFIPPRHALTIVYGFEAKPFGRRILVYKIKKDGPAKKAGLELGDQIVAVNNFRAERASFDQMMLYMRVLNPVPQMDLAVIRGNKPPQPILVKAHIKVGSIMVDLTNLETFQHLFMQEEDEEKAPAEDRMMQGNIGYVRWREFDTDPSPLESSLQSVHKAKAVVLDLRGNPGGALDTLEEVAGNFVTDQVVMATTKMRKEDEAFKVKPRNPHFSQPLFILVDSESASAAEIFARYFQLTKRATIIGDQTSGRVATAEFFPERYGMLTIVPFGLEIDVGHVFFGNGEDLERRGVTPDKSCLPSPDDLLNHRDPCLQLAQKLAEHSADTAH